MLESGQLPQQIMHIARSWSCLIALFAACLACGVAGWPRTRLDVMRVDTGDGASRCSVCYATYGYMGDLLRTSEGMRWSRCVIL